MSENIYANFYRAGSAIPYAKNIYILLSKMDAKESSFYQGADPYFTYRVYTRQLPIDDVTLVQQRDLMIDQRVIDPTTNALRQYRIISDPQPKTLMMEWQFAAVKVRGT